MAAHINRPPTREELLAAAGRGVPDVIAPGLRVLFCGINPGLYSGAVGHHFARPGNRFWPALFAAGFTDRLLKPYEEKLLLGYGCGITNIVNSATAQASELTAAALQEGARRLEKTAARFRPGAVAILGIDAYRKAFGRTRAALGRQPEKIAGSILWVLPNPSGINASYRMADLVRLFAELRSAPALLPII
jgi:TDG/mug DNA glycosylase family protein